MRGIQLKRNMLRGDGQTVQNFRICKIHCLPAWLAMIGEETTSITTILAKIEKSKEIGRSAPAKPTKAKAHESARKGLPEPSNKFPGKAAEARLKPWNLLQNQ